MCSKWVKLGGIQLTQCTSNRAVVLAGCRLCLYVGGQSRHSGLAKRKLTLLDCRCCHHCLLCTDKNSQECEAQAGFKPQSQGALTQLTEDYRKINRKQVEHLLNTGKSPCWFYKKKKKDILIKLNACIKMLIFAAVVKGNQNLIFKGHVAKKSRCQQRYTQCKTQNHAWLNMQRTARWGSA